MPTKLKLRRQRSVKRGTSKTGVAVQRPEYRRELSRQETLQEEDNGDIKSESFRGRHLEREATTDEEEDHHFEGRY